MSKMRNVTGSPVENDDFFDRPKDLARLQRELRNEANLLITAPRRVGKTSLVLRLCQLEEQKGNTAVFINVEGCHDELAFAEKLVDSLKEKGQHPELFGKIVLAFGKARQALKGLTIGAAGVSMEMGPEDDTGLGTLNRVLDSVFHRIEDSKKPLLVAIDELPELLLAIGKQAHGEERVARLLHWLRSLRQTYRKHVRWIFLGSIGLDTFIDERQLQKTINDLTPLSLESLTPDEADQFLTRLGQDNDLSLSPEARSQIIERLGWPLPHHLQILFHALVDQETRFVDKTSVEAAFQHPLQPAYLNQFDTWRQRLDQQFTANDARAAKDILNHLCLHTSGRSRDRIMQALIATRGEADPAQVEEQLSRLLQMLERDGYLLRNGKRHAFRSFLLRDYWRRRHLTR